MAGRSKIDKEVRDLRRRIERRKDGILACYEVIDKFRTKTTNDEARIAELRARQ